MFFFYQSHVPLSFYTYLCPNIVDDMLPRVDISAQLSSSLLQKLNDANWKERKAALEEIDSILNSANKRVTGQLLDLASALKTRLSDANISITNQTLSVVGNLIESLGKEFDKYYKQIVPGLLGKLGDPKAVVRSQAICAARLAAQNVSSDKMVRTFSLRKNNLDVKNQATCCVLVIYFRSLENIVL